MFGARQLHSAVAVACRRGSLALKSCAAAAPVAWGLSFSAHLRARPVPRLAAFWGLLVCMAPLTAVCCLFLLFHFTDSLPAILLRCGSVTSLAVACPPEQSHATQLTHACMRGQCATLAAGQLNARQLQRVDSGRSPAPSAFAGLAWR